jgi:hypothetical protein
MYQEAHNDTLVCKATPIISLRTTSIDIGNQKPSTEDNNQQETISFISQKLANEKMHCVSGTIRIFRSHDLTQKKFTTF